MSKRPTPSFFEEIVAEVGEGDPPEKCRHGRYLRCEDCQNERWRLHSANGKYDGLRIAAEALKAAVGSLFADGKDDEARTLRSHMRGIEDRAREAASEADRARAGCGIKVRS